jgi:peroxiredoxin
MTTTHVLARILSIAGVFTAASASAPMAAGQPDSSSQLIGTWFNQDPETMGITQVVVFDRSGKVFVHAWGACMPTDCDQGEAEVRFTDGQAGATFDVGFAKTHMNLLRLPSGKLLVVDKSEYSDHPEIKSKEETNFFILAPESQTTSAVEARALLRKVADAHRQLTNVEFEVDATHEEKQKVSTWHLKEMFADGDRSRIETDRAGEHLTSISDGRTNWTLFPESHQFSSHPVGTASQRVDSYNTIDIFAAAARITGLEQVDGHTCRVLVIERPNQLRTLWIDSQTSAVLKDRTVIRSTKTGEIVSAVTFRISTPRTLTDTDNGLFTFEPEKQGYRARDELQRQALTSSVGTKAPDFTLSSVTGTTVSLSDLRGKIVLLDFWATWCTPCREEMPTIELLSRQFKDKGLVVLGIDDEDATTQKDFMEKSGFSFLSLLEPKKQVTNQFHISGIPTIVLIDRGGSIRLFELGEPSFATLRDNIEKISLN